MQNNNHKNHDNIVYIFGDSHCVIFLGAEKIFEARVAGYDSASLSGLNEKTSRLEYGKHITDIVTCQPKTYHMLLKLGQVDIEFIMYYKFYIKKEIFTFEEFSKSLIDKYRNFINKLLQINKNIIISSINLPSYYDSVNIQEYISRIITNGSSTSAIEIRDGVDAKLCDFSLTQITENFKYFNKLLHDLTIEMNLKFFDAIPLFIDDNKKLLKNEYQDYGHHYKGYCDTSSQAKSVTHNFFHSFFESNFRV